MRGKRSHERVLTAVWLLAAMPVGFFGYLAFALAETEPDRRVGLVLVVSAGLAIVTGGLLMRRPRTAVLRGSLLVSFLWLAGAAWALATMDFAQDRLLLGGGPAAVAVITGAIAVARLRASGTGADDP